MMEIFNIGIDIINIERFKKKEYAKNKKFYQKIFSKSEIEYCLEFKNSSEHFAGKFAIKEAVRKSLKEKVPFNKILTTHKNSKPRIILKMKLNYEFLVSVSHETNMALAIVIALKK
jgi:holo-[acyl-carrier protein] synthase